MVGGLVFLGFALHDLIPWIRTAIAWAIYVFGTLTATVAIEAYSLDIFPEQAAEAAAWINMSRSVAGFIVNYFRTSPLRRRLLTLRRAAVASKCWCQGEFRNSSRDHLCRILACCGGSGVWKKVAGTFSTTASLQKVLILTKEEQYGFVRVICNGAVSFRPSVQPYN